VNDEFSPCRRWFYAAIYNAVWGVAVVMYPATLLRLTRVNATGAVPLVQVMGMMVGVYAYGYYLVAREPKRYSGFIWIALAGKTLGPLGFVYSAATGAAVELRLGLRVQRPRLVATLLAIRARAREGTLTFNG